MTGELILNAAASGPNDVLRKDAADDLLNGVGAVGVNHTHDATDIIGLDTTGLSKVPLLSGVAGNLQTVIDGFAEPGDTLTGPLVLGQAPVGENDLATLAYLESKAPATTSGPPTGSIARKAFVSSGYAGWLACDGSTPSRTSYPSLYKKLWQHNTPADVSAFGGGVGDVSAKYTAATSYTNGFGKGNQLLIFGNYAYSLGGLYWQENYAYWPFTEHKVLRAPINPDGTFGTFVEYPCDYTGSYNSSFVVIGNRLYVLFGYSNINGETNHTSVRYSIISPNGDLSSFINVPGVFNFTGISGAKAFVVGNKLHVVGGATLAVRDTAQTTIYTADINPNDNSIGAFYENTSVSLPSGLKDFVSSPTRVVKGSNTVLLIGHRDFATQILATTPTTPITVVGFTYATNGELTSVAMKNLGIEGNTVIGNMFEDNLGNVYLEQYCLKADRSGFAGGKVKILTTKIDPSKPTSLLPLKLHKELPCDWANDNSFAGESPYGMVNMSPKVGDRVYLAGMVRVPNSGYPSKFGLRYYMLPLVDQTKQPNTENKDYKFSHRTFCAVGTAAPWQQQAEFNKGTMFGEFNTLKDLLPEGLDFTQVVVTKNKVYLIGGRFWNGSYFQHHGRVYQATIGANGSLSPFTLYASNAPVAALHRCFVYGNKVYHVGGLNDQGGWSNVISAAPIDQNGGLGAWSIHSYMPAAVSAPSIVELKKYIYIVGGYASEIGTSQIYEMTKLANGTDLGSPVAEAMAPLPDGGKSYFASMVSRKNKVFLIGGPGSMNTTYKATVNYNHKGGISPFSVFNTNTLLNYAQSVGIHKAQVIVTMNKVLLIGGSEQSGDNGVRLTHVFGFQANGDLVYEGLGPFLPVAVTNHQCFSVANKIYVLGANVNGTLSRDVYVSTVIDGTAPVDYSPFYNGTYNDVTDTYPTYVFGQKFLPDPIHDAPVFTLPDYTAIDEQFGPGVRSYIKT